VVLFRNGSIAGMAGGDLGNITMALGGGATWALGDEAHVVQYVGNVISPRSASAYANCAKQNVITQHNDNSRSGANLAETVLKPSNVNFSTFGRLFSRQVDGDIVGQPLYVRSVHTAAQGVKNLFFVTTSKNNIYAFDADAPANSPSISVWQRNLCGARHLCVYWGPNNNITDPPNCPKPEICSETRTGFVGITSTPVIDPTTQTMYVVARCSTKAGMADDGAVYIYAINLADGSDQMPRVPIQATDPDPKHHNVTFDYHCQRNRPGLLLSNGVIYVAFATFQCDQNCANTPYRGWVIGYRESDLAQAAVYVVSPDAGGAGIWQTGNGLAAAADGSIYFQTGNAPPGKALQEPRQDSFVKLVPTTGPGGLALGGSTQPNNASQAPPSSWAGSGRGNLNDGDTDLGSGGPMLLPEGMLIGGGKQGRYYLLDQATMHLVPQQSRPLSVGFDGFQACFNQFHNNPKLPACPNFSNGPACAWGANSGTCYIDPNRYGDGEQCGPNIHGGPVFWQTSPTSGMIYKMPEKDFLKGFHYNLTTKQVTESPALTATGSYGKPPQDGMPGGFSSISANGMTDGIVWTSLPNGNGQGNLVPGILVAHDARTLAQLWYDDDDITFAKSVPPTIADGKVFRAVLTNPATATNVSNVTGVVIVYGLLKRTNPRPRPFGLCYRIAEKYANYAGSIGFLGTPTSNEMPIGDKSRGSRRNYRGSIIGMTRTIASIEMSGKGPIPTCSNPKGTSTPVESTIYWSPRTCAHVVMGDIRKLYVRLGGPKGKLGYPIEDETYSPDHFGRISQFEHGEIIWHPDKGARVTYKEPRNRKEDDDRKEEESEKQERPH